MCEDLNNPPTHLNQGRISNQPSKKSYGETCFKCYNTDSKVQTSKQNIALEVSFFFEKQPRSSQNPSNMLSSHRNKQPSRWITREVFVGLVVFGQPPERQQVPALKLADKHSVIQGEGLAGLPWEHVEP